MAFDKKVLKACIRCRKHKTKCDAFIRTPLPCTNCKKRAIQCRLETVSHDPSDRTKLASNVVESLTSEIHLLNQTVDDLILRKNHQLYRLMELNPSIPQIQSCLQDHPQSQSKNSPLYDSSICETGEFVINCNRLSPPVYITYNDAVKYFNNYYKNFHKHLPILPNTFYQSSNINTIYKDHNLLFWCIILASHLNLDKFDQYSHLSNHIKSLVVETCWLKTPRSVYVLISLLILTTWPVPLKEPNETLNDNLSIKYLSLLKNLSLQLGLHRLEFINEFLLKTTINLSSDLKFNNLIRERIYKFVTINSNYWLINMGLLNLNFNGFQQDYIVNKSNNELKQANDTAVINDYGVGVDEDKYINSILKISIIQQRLNENLNNEDGNTISKLIDLNMFEVILNDLTNSKKYPNLLSTNESILISIEYCKLQVYLYSFSINLQLNIIDYKQTVYKALASCYKIIDYFKKDFTSHHHKNVINQLPIHFKFILEFVSLLLLRIYYSPLLNSVEDYELLKQNFDILFTQLQGCKTLVNNKLVKIITKFNQIFKYNLLSLLKFNRSWYLLNKFNNYQISNMNYELVYLIFIFETDKFKLNENNLDWQNFGIHDGKLLSYLKNLQLF